MILWAFAHVLCIIWLHVPLFCVCLYCCCMLFKHFYAYMLLYVIAFVRDLWPVYAVIVIKFVCILHVLLCVLLYLCCVCMRFVNMCTCFVRYVSAFVYVLFLFYTVVACVLPVCLMFCEWFYCVCSILDYVMLCLHALCVYVCMCVCTIFRFCPAPYT